MITIMEIAASLKPKTLHVVPGDSAAGSLRRAIQDAGLEDEVLGWPDDVSCGPIHESDPSARSVWWQADWDVDGAVRSFWGMATSHNDRLVVWFGRHSAAELAFFLAWADRLQGRPYELVDVTEQRFPSRRRDGSDAPPAPAYAAGMLSPDEFRTILGSERTITIQESEQASLHWRRLKSENAPFRIVTPDGLVSAPIDQFDGLLLGRSTQAWQPVARVIGSTMGFHSDPYFQVGDRMLLSRVIALIGEGKLLADGDPRHLHTCRIRLPRLS